jgi:LacI family transcriptional regulator
MAGIIITPVSEEDEITKRELQRFQDNGTPVVLVDRDIPASGFSGVFSDNVESAKQAVVALIKEGHRKIATISGPVTSKPGKERLDGYLMALREFGIEIRPEFIQDGDFRQAKAYECTKNLLDLDDPPTAIFTVNNLTTLGCLQCMTEYNMAIGKDISIVGFDDIDALKAIGYKLSVVDRDINRIGREAIRLLMDLIDTKVESRIEPKKIELPCELVLRGSEKTTTGV